MNGELNWADDAHKGLVVNARAEPVLCPRRFCPGAFEQDAVEDFNLINMVTLVAVAPCRS
jgi:hypothetical protein